MSDEHDDVVEAFRCLLDSMPRPERRRRERRRGGGYIDVGGTIITPRPSRYGEVLSANDCIFCDRLFAWLSLATLFCAISRAKMIANRAKVSILCQIAAMRRAFVTYCLFARLSPFSPFSFCAISITPP